MMWLLPFAWASPHLALPAAETGGRTLLAEAPTHGEARSKAVASALLAGNVPSRCRMLHHLSYEAADASGEVHRVGLWVTPDFVELGTDADAVYAPLDLPSARRLARTLSAVLPTSLISDRIHDADTDPLEPVPMAPNPGMVSTPALLEHQALIAADAQRGLEDGLVSGHKKDLVITSELAEKPGRVAIYGWHHQDGTPIQPVSLWHGEHYVDYSHGVRLVARTMDIDGEQHDLLDVLGHAVLADLVSDEGALTAAQLRRWR